MLHFSPERPTSTGAMVGSVPASAYTSTGAVHGLTVFACIATVRFLSSPQKLRATRRDSALARVVAALKLCALSPNVFGRKSPRAADAGFGTPTASMDTGGSISERNARIGFSLIACRGSCITVLSQGACMYSITAIIRRAFGLNTFSSEHMPRIWPIWRGKDVAGTLKTRTPVVHRVQPREY